jgi:allophanate hydrolase subunit 2
LNQAISFALVREGLGHVTLQGAPKFGLRRFGVPPGGAFDQQSMATANALVGNASNAVCLELAMATMWIRAFRPCTFGIAGAGCKTDPPLENNVIRLSHNREITIEPPSKNARVYVAVSGGFAHTQSGLIRRSEMLYRYPSQPLRTTPIISELPDRPIKVLPFSEDELPAELIENKFDVSLQSDRVGIRLIGPRFEPGPERVSEPACPGTIQVTNDGSLIILGPDGPTIGGYRKIGVVASEDMDLVGQLRPGGQCQFRLR